MSENLQFKIVFIVFRILYIVLNVYNPPLSPVVYIVCISNVYKTLRSTIAFLSLRKIKINFFWSGVWEMG